ncbi:hypothetical protein SLS62_001712 [Diatrype stigma]|uniref:2EXR domain-containing protein n=1 Tax=Diatrype stigma TaxID=117547 RepID=A0AAN9UVB5_9PEZI
MSGRVLNADLAELMNKLSNQCAQIARQNDTYSTYFAARLKKYIEIPIAGLRNQVEEHLEEENDESIGRLIEVIEKLQDDGDENVKVQEELVTTIGLMREELEEVNNRYDAVHASVKRLVEQKKTKEQETLVFQRQVRRQLDELRRLVVATHRGSSGPGQSAPPAFPQFSRFPPELRHLVWRAAVPKRLFCADRSCEDVSFALSVPAIAHVCRESRRVALGLGRLWRMTYGRDPSWSWYTPDRDVFLVRAAEERILPWYAIEEIAIEPPEDWLDDPDEFLPEEAFIDRLTACKWGSPNMFPHLHTVDVLMRKPTLVDKSWDPAVVSKLFGGDSVVVMDLTDSAAYGRVQELLYEGGPGQRNTEEDDGTLDLIDQGTRGHGSLAWRDLEFGRYVVNYSSLWRRARQQLLEKYIFNKAFWTPLTREYAQLWDWDMNPNMEIPWVRDAVNSFRIRPVIIFALLDGRPYTGAQGPKWGSSVPSE